MYPLESLPVALLALSGVLLYFGFAPKAPRWRFSLGILGAGIVIGVWWQASSRFVPIEPRDFFRLGFVEIMNEANSGLCFVTICIGAALAWILRGNRRIAAVGVGVVLPLVIGQIFFGTVSERQRINDAHRLDAVQAALDQHRAMWQANRPGSYLLTIHRSIFCAPGHCPEDETIIVEALFDRIQTAIHENYDTVDVTYHPELGYPVEIFTDPEILRTDGQEHITIRDFRIMP